MAKNKKPRKSRSVKGRVDGCDKNPLAGFAPPSKKELQAICIAAFSNHNMLQDAPQDVTPAGVQMIIDVLDVGRQLAIQGHYTTEYKTVWDKAFEGLKSLTNRYKTTGKIGYDGWAIDPIGQALAIHMQQLEGVSKTTLLNTIDALIKDKKR